MRDFYEILGVWKSATSDDLLKARRKFASKYHPDKNPGKEAEVAEKMQEVNAAYDVLSDPEKRYEYDQGAWGHPKSSRQQSQSSQQQPSHQQSHSSSGTSEAEAFARSHGRHFNASLSQMYKRAYEFATESAAKGGEGLDDAAARSWALDATVYHADLNELDARLAELRRKNLSSYGQRSKSQDGPFHESSHTSSGNQSNKAGHSGVYERAYEFATRPVHNSGLDLDHSAARQWAFNAADEFDLQGLDHLIQKYRLALQYVYAQPTERPDRDSVISQRAMHMAKAKTLEEIGDLISKPSGSSHYSDHAYDQQSRSSHRNWDQSFRANSSGAYDRAYQFAAQPIQNFGLGFDQAAAHQWAFNTSDKLGLQGLNDWIEKYQLSFRLYEASHPVGQRLPPLSDVRDWAMGTANQFQHWEIDECLINRMRAIMGSF